MKRFMLMWKTTILLNIQLNLDRNIKQGVFITLIQIVPLGLALLFWDFHSDD